MPVSVRQQKQFRAHQKVREIRFELVRLMRSIVEEKITGLEVEVARAVLETLSLSLVDATSTYTSDINMDRVRVHLDAAGKVRAIGGWG